jgi:hypothetical protein
VAYGVEEEMQEGWLPLTATSHDFGMLVPGEPYVHTFVNAQSVQNVQVTACKAADDDGDLATTGDQSPVEGWRLYLTVDGTPQGSGQVTGANGCAVWSDLEPGVAYGVEEEMQAGWQPLAATSHEFGVLVPGEAYVHTFVNAETVEVNACKLEDADGELATTGDQTPVEGWTIYLLVDGTLQEPGQSTGSDGCTTWSDLAPAVAYGVQEEMQEGWSALTPTSVGFDPAPPGASYAAEFINTQAAYWIYLPLITK